MWHIVVVEKRHGIDLIQKQGVDGSADVAVGEERGMSVQVEVIQLHFEAAALDTAADADSSHDQQAEPSRVANQLAGEVFAAEVVEE